MDNQLILNNRQLAWMANHHAQIALAYDEINRGQGNTALRKLISSTEYVEIFANMDWDDAYDRYQCDNAYDETLFRLLNLRLSIEVSSAWKNPEIQEELRDYAPNAFNAPSADATLDQVGQRIQELLSKTR